jgi:hypothetical protein
MNQATMADPRVDIFAEPTLTELIDNNKIVLETKIDKDIIKNFVKQFYLLEKKVYLPFFVKR